MSALIVDVCLAVAVLSAWIAAFGFLRLGWSLDRLHCVGFVYVACGCPIAIAAFAADGASTRAFKVLLLELVALIAGASLTQALAQAIFTRDEAGERT